MRFGGRGVDGTRNNALFLVLGSPSVLAMIPWAKDPWRSPLFWPERAVRAIHAPFCVR